MFCFVNIIRWKHKVKSSIGGMTVRFLRKTISFFHYENGLIMIWWEMSGIRLCWDWKCQKFRSLAFLKMKLYELKLLAKRFGVLNWILSKKFCNLSKIDFKVQLVTVWDLQKVVNMQKVSSKWDSGWSLLIGGRCPEVVIKTGLTLTVPFTSMEGEGTG